jgi:hypothetical protein
MAKTVITLAASLLVGCAGGIAGTLIILHHKPEFAQAVVRAHSFELIDDRGKAVSRWGIDENHNPLIAFMPSAATPLSASSVMDLSLEDRGTQRVAIGLTGDANPFLTFRGNDKRPRVQLWVSEFGQPVFSLYDENSCRAVLGVRRSDTPSANDRDWGLDFLPDRAGIGMGTVRKDGRNYAQGYFYLHQDQTPVP